MRKYLNMQKANLQDAIFQVAFLINNQRYESALEIIQVNEISLKDLSLNKAINNLDDFRVFVKNKMI